MANPFSKALNYLSGKSVVDNAANPNSAYSKTKVLKKMKTVPNAKGPINKAGLQMGSMENNGKPT